MRIDREQLLTLKSFSDIGKSAFSQLKKNNENDNFDGDEAEGSNKFLPAAKRCLELIFEAEGEELVAIEKEFVPVLTRKLDRGMKFRLVPPVQVIKNILMLRKMNLQFVSGGMGDNCELEQLERRLLDNGGVAPERKRKFDGKLSNLSISEMKSSKGSSSVIATGPTKTKSNLPSQSQSLIQTYFASTGKIEATHKREPKKEENPFCEEGDDWEDDDEFHEILKKSVTKEDDWEDDCGLFDDLPVVTKKERLPQSEAKRPKGSSSVANIHHLCETKLPNTFQMIGFIHSVVGKIRQSPSGEFSVVVEIGDHSGVLRVLLGHSAFEYMFEQIIPTSLMKTWTSSAREQYKARGKHAQKKIYDFYGRIHIRKLPFERVSCLYEAFKFTEI